MPSERFFRKRLWAFQNISTLDWCLKMQNLFAFWSPLTICQGKYWAKFIGCIWYFGQTWKDLSETKETIEFTFIICSRITKNISQESNSWNGCGWSEAAWEDKKIHLCWDLKLLLDEYFVWWQKSLCWNWGKVLWVAAMKWSCTESLSPLLLAAPQKSQLWKHYYPCEDVETTSFEGPWGWKLSERDPQIANRRHHLGPAMSQSFVPKNKQAGTLLSCDDVVKAANWSMEKSNLNNHHQLHVHMTTGILTK